MAFSPDLLDTDFAGDLFRRGAHVCLLYESEDERRLLMSKFIESGLKGGEKVLYLTDVMKPAELRGWLAGLGVVLPSDGDSDRFVVADAESVYCAGGRFDPERMFTFWGELDAETRAHGYPGVRATGETSWAVRGIPGSDRLIEYESRLTAVLDRIAVTAVCQYDVHLFDGKTILDVLRVHPVLVSHGQLVLNPFYRQPEEPLLEQPRG